MGVVLNKKLAIIDHCVSFFSTKVIVSCCCVGKRLLTWFANVGECIILMEIENRHLNWENCFSIQ